jgi:pimeloyl-ACP methyl ester carboxylesterase
MPKRRTKWLVPVGIAAAVLVLLIGSYVYCLYQPAVLDEKARQGVPGGWATLSQGVVHYELAGPENAPTVVLVHGFTIPSFIFDPTFEALVKAGFRVLRFDLYGRGWSDRPAVRYDLDLFVGQLGELLDHLGLKSPVGLVGLSMGGAVAAAFADRFPERVDRLALIAPMSFPLPETFSTRLARLPVVGDWIMMVLGDRMLVSRLKQNFYDPSRFLDVPGRYREQMKYRGYKQAVLSTLRYLPFSSDFSPLYQRIARRQLPVMLVWGLEDAVIPYKYAGRLKKVMPAAALHVADHAGHSIHYEWPDAMNPLLIRFFTPAAAGASG